MYAYFNNSDVLTDIWPLWMVEEFPARKIFRVPIPHSFATEPKLECVNKVLVKLSNIKFHRNRFSCSGVDTNATETD